MEKTINSPRGAKSPEMADIFCKYSKAYIESHSMPLEHYKIMNAIVVCRTAVLGGHVEVCDSCGKTQNSYNFCRNRHCPKCQALTKAKWLEARQAELLPVPYFHNVFTLPHELNLIILCNKRIMLDIFFKTNTCRSGFSCVSESPKYTQSEKENRWVEWILSFKQTYLIRSLDSFPLLVELLNSYFKEQEPGLSWI